MVGREVRAREPERVRVVAGAVPRRPRLELPLAQHLHVVVRVRRTPAGPAFTVVAPSSCSAIQRNVSHEANVATCAPIETALAADDLEHGRERLPPVVVAVDLRVVRRSGGDLGSSPGTRSDGGCDAHHAAGRLVSRNRAVLGQQGAPENGISLRRRSSGVGAQ